MILIANISEGLRLVQYNNITKARQWRVQIQTQVLVNPVVVSISTLWKKFQLIIITSAMAQEFKYDMIYLML